MTFQFLRNESNLKVFPIEICKFKLEFSDKYEREILMKKFWSGFFSTAISTVSLTVYHFLEFKVDMKEF